MSPALCHSLPWPHALLLLLPAASQQLRGTSPPCWGDISLPLGIPPLQGPSVALTQRNGGWGMALSPWLRLPHQGWQRCPAAAAGLPGWGARSPLPTGAVVGALPGSSDPSPRGRGARAGAASLGRGERSRRAPWRGVQEQGWSWGWGWGTGQPPRLFPPRRRCPHCPHSPGGVTAHPSTGDPRGQPIPPHGPGRDREGSSSSSILQHPPASSGGR